MYKLLLFSIYRCQEYGAGAGDHERVGYSRQDSDYSHAAALHHETHHDRFLDQVRRDIKCSSIMKIAIQTLRPHHKKLKLCNFSPRATRLTTACPPQCLMASATLTTGPRAWAAAAAPVSLG